MPSDIRSFFGGKGAAPATQSQSSKPEPVKPKPQQGSRGKRKVLEDSDDDDVFEIAKPATPKRAAPKKFVNAVSPKGEATNTSDYFASSKKAKKAQTNGDSRSEVNVEEPAGGKKAGSTPKKAASKPATPSVEVTPRKPTRGSAATHNKPKTIDVDSASDEEPVRPRGKASAKKDDDDFFPTKDEKPSKAKSSTPKKSNEASKTLKRKTPELDEDDSEEIPTKKPRAKKATKSTPSNADLDGPADLEVKAILNSVPTVRAPTPPPPEARGKFNFKTNNANAGPPPLAGTKDIPQGKEGCFTGMTFVFTGILDSLSRDDGIELVKRYGGKITTAPSSKTSVVVLGNDAGPKKLDTIAKLKLKTINEEGLFELLRRLPAGGGDTKAAAKIEEKRLKQESQAQEEAERMAREEKQKEAEAAKARRDAVKAGRPVEPVKPKADAELWTVKYAPTAMNQICGNKPSIDKLQNWLKKWSTSAKSNFKKGGPDGSGLYRAAIIHGGPGIGKTTAAHLIAKLEGYDVVETNASDTRSKKLVEAGLKGVLDTTSLLGYFSGDGKDVDTSKRKLCLIMDEVDGMSAGDRGGVGALAAVCRKTNVPLILICNDRRLPKMKPFDHVTYDIPFRKPTVDQIKARMMTILYREGMKDLVPAKVIEQIVEGSRSDIRQVINMLSTAKLDSQAMGFEEGKKMASEWEKRVVLKPWDIVGRILGGGLFAPSSKATLNDKIELYFNDHEFSSLMLQENYLNTSPVLANDAPPGKPRMAKVMELFDRAAESISDGDLVDAMIHGSQQQWSLMPTHAVFSFVRPASMVWGSSAGNGTRFTSYLGNLSKGGKLSRNVKEIQGHMRLRASADRHEIRQQYLPFLWTRLVKDLELYGGEQEGIQRVIDLMDSYFITKDDWDAIVELGVGPNNDESVKIPSQIKSNFTRKYNAMSHPLPFMKAAGGPAPAKKGKERPDLEEALEESDDEALLADPPPEEEDEELDLKKDKYVTAPKKKKAPPKRAKKAQQDDDDDDDEGDEDVKPKSKAKGKGKAKK